jgi:hypothetical protein
MSSRRRQGELGLYFLGWTFLGHNSSYFIKIPFLSAVRENVIWYADGMLALGLPPAILYVVSVTSFF